MKVAVVYNRDSKKVINLFGVPSREKYGLKAVQRIVEALKKGGHAVVSLEGDKDLVPRLEEFMPRVLQGERPGMVFNISYGIQGQARYTHVPGMLEMVGIPYVGSGPLAHSLALDKVVSKMLFNQQGLPTPDFTVLDEAGFALPEIPFPMIVKPKNESTSFGLRIVNDEPALREAADHIFREFGQPVLVEAYIAGREINVGLLGNGPPEVFPPAELVFPETGPPIYTLDDKFNLSGRNVRIVCPADLPGETADRARELSLGAFQALGCSDCARVDLRLDAAGGLHILELNSLPSLGEQGSYIEGASATGLDFPALVNRLVETASARYFGTPHPPRLSAKSAEAKDLTFSFVTQRRDRMERRLQRWTGLSSRTDDPIGVDAAFRELDRRMREAGLEAAPSAAEGRVARLWQSPLGLENGTLLALHVDVPLFQEVAPPVFRREPEWLVGEGIAVSRAPLVMLEFALRAAKSQSVLKRTPLGVLAYADEGQDARHSAKFIRSVASRARRVLVLAPGTPAGKIVTGRRGLRKYGLRVEGVPRRVGHTGKGTEVLPWLCEKVAALTALSDRKARIAVSAVDLRARAHPMLLPHRATLTFSAAYPTPDAALDLETKIRETLGRRGPPWALERLSDRPPRPKNAVSQELASRLADIGRLWDIPLQMDTSQHPSVAGLVPPDIPAVCGLAPPARDLFTPQEAVQRLGLVQRTLLLAQFLVETASLSPRRSTRGTSR